MKKFLPYILIIFVLVGLFIPGRQANAQTTPPSPTELGKCFPPNGTSFDSTRSACAYIFVPNNNLTPPTTPAPNTDSPFKQEIDEGCGGLFSWSLDGCILKLFYYTYYQIPTFILWLSALLFNVLVRTGLDSTMTSSSNFISAAWAVVRDLSNIFFILVLLYIAIQTILGIGHETKKMIVKVLIMALLINFSMFFTKIVIDTSNILALVFYNKLDADPGRQYTPSTPNQEKDISGQMYKAFRATDLLTQQFLNQVKQETSKETLLPLALKLGLIALSGTIMLFAAYAFFVSGFMFLGRLIELWVLIIFSPFAFMSWTIPKLSGVSYIGWDEWSKRLVSTSFMAPIFMLFMYLIFLLIRANPFANFFQKDIGFVATILGVLIPSLLIIALLLKATKFAEKGGGAFGELVVKYGKMAGGLALGAVAATASGGASLAVGGLAARAASSQGLQSAAKATGLKGIAGRMALRTADYGSKASFDIRKTGLGSLAKAGGMNLGTVREGGYAKMRADTVKKRQERAKQLEVREDETLKQNLNKVEQDLQDLLRTNAHEIEMIDKQITSARQKLRDATATYGGGSNEARAAGAVLDDLKGERSARKGGTTFTSSDGYVHDYTTNRVGGVAEGASINDLEDHIIPHAHDAIEKENRARKWAYADRIQGSKATFWRRTRANREAAHKIRTGAKIESSGDKGHGGGGGGGHAPTPTPTPAPRAAGGGGGGGHAPAAPH